MGGLTELAYCSELGVGHVIMINSGDGGALWQIQKLIKDFETRAQKPKEAQTIADEAPKISIDPALAGYYREIAPRTQMTAWLLSITDARHYRIVDGGLERETFFGKHRQKYTPVSPTRFRSVSSGLIELAVTTDPLAGPVLVEDGFVGQRVTAFRFFYPLVLLGAWMLAILGSFVFAIVWVIRFLSGSLRKGPTIQVRVWPLLAGVSILLAFVFNVAGMKDMFASFGRPSVASVGLMLGTMAFALLSGWSVITVIKERKSPMNRWNYWFAAVLSVPHLLVTLYFLSAGVIGLRTWA